PAAELPIVSLHEMMRYLSEQGYDRSFLDQIRAVLATEPGLTLQEISMGDQAIHQKAVEILLGRPGVSPQDAPELHALTARGIGEARGRRDEVRGVDVRADGERRRTGAAGSHDAEEDGQQADGRDDFAEPEAVRRSRVGRPRHGVELEHEVGDDRTGVRAGDL